MTTCPNCGFHHQKEFDLDVNALKLSRVKHAIALRLLQARGGLVRHDQLIDFVYGDRPDGGPDGAMNSLRANIVKTRSRLQLAGWTIKSEWGQGYRLVKQEG